MSQECRIYQELLVQEALGETSERERAFLKNHLDSCEDCRAELAGFADTIGLLKRERPVTAPAGLAQRTLRRVESAGERIVAASSSYRESGLFRPGSWRYRKSLIGWMVAASVLVMLTASLLPGLITPDSSREIHSCQSNMRIVAMALRQYANDHSGFYPQGADWYRALDYEYLRRVGALTCPSRLAVGAPSADETDYVYNSGRIGVNSGDDLPVLWDSKAAHDRLGRNVLFADGSVRWLGESDFERLLVRFRLSEGEILQ